MKINTSKKIYRIIIPLALLVLLFSYGAYAYTARQFPFQKKDPFDREINYEKSDAEKSREQAIKSDPEEKFKNDQRDIPASPEINQQTNQQSVNVLLTYAGISQGNISASGFISDISQEGGKCQYIFTKDDQKITRDVPTLVNPTSTTCETISLPVSDFTAGEWSVLIMYESSNAKGVSSTKKVIVP